MMSFCRRVNIAMTLFFILSVLPAGAMIRTLPVDELVRTSDFIVIAEVEKVSTLGTSRLTGDYTITHLKNDLKLMEAIKGSWPPDETIVIKTVKPEKGWLEDNVELPPPGSRVLLFFVTDGRGNIRPVNGIQGIWPLKEGKPMGMGTGKSIDDIREKVRTQQSPQP